MMPKPAREIRGIKFLGDASAHNPLIDIDMKTIVPQMPYIITAYANDHAFEYSFYSALQVWRQPGDAVLIFSCSGKSPNYIEFVSSGVHPLAAVVGTDGGFLKGKADCCVHVKSDDYRVCETSFSVVADMVMSRLGDE